MDKHLLGERIRKFRKEQKLTLEQLAEKCDIGMVYLGEIERGIKMPSLKTFLKIIRALDISADTVVYDQTAYGKKYVESELTEQFSELTAKETAVVKSIMESTIKQIKLLRD